MPSSRLWPRRSATVVLTLFACFASSIGPVAETSSESAPQNVVVASLERYASGDFDAAVKQLIGAKKVSAVLGAFRKDANAWIDRASDAERAQRISVTGAMSVELLTATFDQHRDEYMRTRGIIEWACERFRRLPPSEVERWFDHGATALAQGSGDHEFIEGYWSGRYRGGSPHARHPVERFPRDNRFQLALATVHVEAQQITTWPLAPASIIHPERGNFTEAETRAAEAMDYTLQALSELFGDPAVGGEARLRSGVLRFLREDTTVAVTDLTAAELSPDPTVRHLAHLMLGTIADREGNADEALKRYKLAYEEVPAATASVALAGRLFRSGAADDAAMVLRTFNSQPPPVDPWEFYGQRDFKSFGAIRQQMRDAVLEVTGRPGTTELPPTATRRMDLPFGATTPVASTSVAVPVLVQASGEPVPDLTIADFALTDSGVSQTITSARVEAKALDVTVIAPETTQNRSGKFETLDVEIAAVASALTPADRLTVMLAGRDPRPFTPPGTRDLIREAALVDRCVPVYDTLARAIMQPAEGDRQRVVILISAGEGRGGFLRTDPVAEIARRANVRLYVANVEWPRQNTYIASAVCPEVGVDFSKDRQDRLRFLDGEETFKGIRLLQNDQKLRLVGIAESTAGREIRPAVFRERTNGSLRDALDESRSAYILRYTPNGVSHTGWHPITVKLTKPGSYEIRVRAGYER